MNEGVKKGGGREGGDRCCSLLSTVYDSTITNYNVPTTTTPSRRPCVCVWPKQRTQSEGWRRRSFWPLLPDGGLHPPLLLPPMPRGNHRRMWKPQRNQTTATTRQQQKSCNNNKEPANNKWLWRWRRRQFWVLHNSCVIRCVRLYSGSFFFFFYTAAEHLAAQSLCVTCLLIEPVDEPYELQSQSSTLIALYNHDKRRRRRRRWGSIISASRWSSAMRRWCFFFFLPFQFRLQTHIQI